MQILSQLLRNGSKSFLFDSRRRIEIHQLNMARLTLFLISTLFIIQGKNKNFNR